ncbi:hypothetical protein like AT1G29660 [Hibiscus trionum]|uniref:Uncharacterized protein n=1 Tax=Hibiscus trionum TaxID=183268 RepID=A0A9W7HLH7_HIBTR|nr:hypothetical protein like AT1G29660 [Hibiscus trionum]
MKPAEVSRRRNMLRCSFNNFHSNLRLCTITGARKFAVYGIGRIGCTPYAISVFRSNGSECVLKLKEGA